MSQAADDKLLLEALGDNPAHTLWLADENVLHLVSQAPHDITLLSNRWDICNSADHLAQNFFSDWDLSVLPHPDQIQRVVYQVSKEKAVVAHLINEIAERIKPGSQLKLIGRKNEGIKSLTALAAGRLRGGKLKKAGNLYLAELEVTQAHSEPVDDLDYVNLRPTLSFQGHSLLSKPGTFGWQKLDEGSLLLLATLAERQPPATPKRILDLGCGYGLLTVGAQQLFRQPEIQWLATDNCAAALHCARANCHAGTDVFAGDRGLDAAQSRPRPQVDLILCNPPFHQGFDTSGDLTDKFLQAMQQWLTPDGRVILVINRFVGIEKRLNGRFRQCTSLADNGSFRVLELSGRV